MKQCKAKRWRLAPSDTKLQSELVQGLGVYPIVAKLLIDRGITTIEAGQQFLGGQLTDLLDPFSLKGMDAAVPLIEEAVKQQDKIVIYGDYDVDGITATSLLYLFLTRLGANVSYYIPERQSEGYGLNEEAVEQLIAEGTSLVITVDCGISSYNIVEMVRDRLTMIITDHHTAPPEIPRAAAVINPKQPGCTYEDKNLSGVGVVFKLCQALWKNATGEEYVDNLDIVALGTVADVVPLVGENRIIVREGLRKMNASPNKGIAALIDVAGLGDKKISAGHIGFTLAPRLNAAGRVTHATRAVELLVTSNQEEANVIAEELQATNQERQQIERTIHEEARMDVINQGELADKVIVVAGEGWHPGVIGIVASRLVEEYYKPALVISIHDGIGKGSCRSIENCNIYDALKSAEDLMLQFGGHKQAAGFSIVEENIPALRERLTAYCAEHLTDDDYVPIVDIDAAIEAEDITIELINQIETLEPYGMGNSTPIFAIDKIAVQDVFLLGQQKNHCKIILQSKLGPLDAMIWHGEEYHREIFPDEAIKVAFSLQKNEWQGRVSPQLMVQDLTLLEKQRTKLTTEGLRAMYMIVKDVFRSATAPKYIVESEVINRHPADQTDKEAILSLDVFKELGILQEETTAGGLAVYRWCHVKEKLDLITSLTFLKYST
ncbi:MAG: single-stranded-DNA-specific exonuclease RecJ [Veillonella sp.]|uniref:single-stranded-DNA-specific exonuclease RecJ n=1 Tax=Veillonella sp. TaxID=1926307 RepID=UPI0025EFD32C|nr:single-stranded-DNA-specific exonuclease RecJ [Veillonella sp.]MBS4914005.1 single-stranded-DNA-specific exonuclease RecJ [Veillonella sp.]